MLSSSALFAGLMLPRSAAAQAPPDAPDAYWACADRLQSLFDPRWQSGSYQPAQAMVNANLLLTHAAAALAGHDGPARNDERARALVNRLCTGPAWITKGAGNGTQAHVPGWRDGLNGGGIQHLVVDTEIAWALSVAWKARNVLGVDGDLIADRIISTTNGKFWTWPTLRLNQINWYARMYVAAATVGGDATALYGELLKQVRRFVDGTHKPMAGAASTNLTSSYRFHYLPGEPDRHKYNLDSAEYANIVCGFLVAYRQARDAGMPPLDESRAAVVRAWVERVISGYWTHAGYLNWDTGLGFKRWHQGKKLGLSQAALLGIAVCPELTPRGPWAKWMFDRSLELFERWVDRAHGMPPANAFDVPSIDDDEQSAVLAGARVQANAAQAALLGMSAMTATEPPPLYAFDPDIGRLAVTTPTYNTAVVPVNRGAFPYGGMDLARLFDGSQDVASGVGGRPPASFGVVVRDSAGRIVAASQRAVDENQPLQLLEPHKTTPPFAGPFTSLRVRGKVVDGAITIETTHHFTKDWIETTWKVSGAAGRSVEVLFPSWGGSAARISTLSDGTFHIQSAETGYVAAIVRGGSGATTVQRKVGPQSSDPHPGPTLAVRIKGSSVTARIAIARTADEARVIAAKLR